MLVLLIFFLFFFFKVSCQQRNLVAILATPFVKRRKQARETQFANATQTLFQNVGQNKWTDGLPQLKKTLATSQKIHAFHQKKVVNAIFFFFQTEEDWLIPPPFGPCSSASPLFDPCFSAFCACFCDYLSDSTKNRYVILTFQQLQTAYFEVFLYYRDEKYCHTSVYMWECIYWLCCRASGATHIDHLLLLWLVG